LPNRSPKCPINMRENLMAVIRHQSVYVINIVVIYINICIFIVQPPVAPPTLPRPQVAIERSTCYSDHSMMDTNGLAPSTYIDGRGGTRHVSPPQHAPTSRPRRRAKQGMPRKPHWPVIVCRVTYRHGYALRSHYRHLIPLAPH
jgi:hypothetical protein